MAKIFIGIPSVRQYQPFLNSLQDFLVEATKEHQLEIFDVKNMVIDEARNVIAEKFLASDKEYLLFLDDDHSGHSIGMLNALLNADTYVCAIKCYQRYFPYLENIMDYSGHAVDSIKYKEIKQKSGTHAFDLVGFGMTLIKRETFGVLERPYFVCQDNKREDNYFCDNLIAKGIKPMACLDYTLEHQGIGSHNFAELRKQGMDNILSRIQEQYPGQLVENITIVS